MVKLASISLSPELEADKVSWMNARSGKFTVNEAYMLTAEGSKDDGWEGWRMLWKMRIQQRVKVFAWIMVHDKLMTNSEGWRRRLTHSPVCARCVQGDEGVMHAIRDYTHAREVWFCLLPSELQTNFFLMDIRDWIV